MTPQEFLDEFGTLAESVEGVPKLRELILELAVRGKLEFSAAERRQRVAPGVSPGSVGPHTHSSPEGVTGDCRATNCVAPAGLSVFGDDPPRADARGYVLSPLRGSMALANPHRMIGGAE